ncbi:MAG TPA: hypothetical protein VMG58_12935, partial [Candidatus Sulfotelmatobacter sp.]|nr:hypothetical protein [Candidatus Sulfotelmatobacter sp.]
MSLAAPVAAATLSLAVEEPCGLPRQAEPISLGVPLPRGAVLDVTDLALQDASGRLLPLQAEVLGRWPDRSLKWALLDFQLTLAAHEAAELFLTWDGRDRARPLAPALQITNGPEAILVDTGAAVFRLDRRTFRPFAAIGIGGRDGDALTSELHLRDADDRSCLPEIQRLRVAASGPLRATIRSEGVFRAPDGEALAEFLGEVTLYAGRGLTRVALTLRNPRPAHHPGGLWDLGDPGSLYFRDLSLSAR